MKSKSGILTMLKEAGILFGITLIAGLLLGFVYEITKEPIARQQALKIQRACAAVFEEADSFEEKVIDTSGLLDFEIQDALAGIEANGVTIGTIYSAMSADRTVLGYVLSSTTKDGFGGPIKIMIGVSLDGTVKGISILSISETPGLGMNAEDDLIPQFAGKQAEAFVYTKAGAIEPNEVDVISGATITTDAIVDAVNGGLVYFKYVLQEGGDE